MVLKLLKIFDFQIISKNKNLENHIKATEARYGIGEKRQELSDDDLEIFAAGDNSLKDIQAMEDDKDK